MTGEEDHYFIGAEAIEHSSFSNAGSKPLHRPEAKCKADALAYILFERPDLAKQRSFLEDFGMQLVQSDEQTMYFRVQRPFPAA